MIDFTDVLLLCLYNHDCLFPDRCDEMAQRKVEPINETCHSCLIFNWPRFLCTILLCQKSFLKVSSKWLLKNKSDNGKLLLGKTYSGEHFRAILALLFANTALKFTHNVCLYMKLCIFCPWTQFCPEIFSLVLRVLLWNLYIMFVYIWSCSCAIFMTILSLVVELSPRELVNFTELLLSREIILQHFMFWTQSYTWCYW